MINSNERTKTGTADKELEVIIDNGDFKLIDELVDAYSLKDRNSLLKFAIAALLQANNNEGLFTIKKNAQNQRQLSKIDPSVDMVKDKGAK